MLPESSGRAGRLWMWALLEGACEGLKCERTQTEAGSVLQWKQTAANLPPLALTVSHPCEGSAGWPKITETRAPEQQEAVPVTWIPTVTRSRSARHQWERRAGSRARRHNVSQSGAPEM
ncbi:hypothetical protein SKAU_G00307020 [Synaphobranchus kaupii]|uniref:Uncharacterized protein n=1 Tax=Synaphobranchus kaupii TaxID=118154 RepID=A0A9Q1EQZ9_SYNKA|nr:hypothetical protein SKAU_G00307020 [Synaphobranchus kaupii]